jgi:hypothetical protein
VVSGLLMSLILMSMPRQRARGGSGGAMTATPIVPLANTGK